MREARSNRDRIGGYRLGRCLGTGGMGAVFEATQDDGRRVALKVMHESSADDAYRRARFHDEAIAGTIVSHPNVVAVFDHGTTDDGRPFVVMERAQGQTVRERIRAGSQSLREIVAIATQLLRALQGMHALGVVHGDVKPENVIVDVRRDQTVCVKLIDLGLATVWFGKSEAARMDVVSGTPDYMAPEVIRGEGVSPASDIYAAMVMLYEMLTGSTPFGGGTALEILARHLEEVVVPPSLRAPELDLPAVFDALVLRGLAKAASDRFASATAAIRALETVPLVHPIRRVRRFSSESPTTRVAARRRLARGTSRRDDARAELASRARAMNTLHSIRHYSCSIIVTRQQSTRS